MRRTPRYALIRILIHMHDRQEHSIHMRQNNIHHCKIGTHFRRVKEGLVGIQYGCPVSTHRTDCGIPCSCKIILPRKINDLRPCIFSKRARPIL